MTIRTEIPESDEPTVVLVHGAFADSSSWNGVIEELERDGYRVIAAANPLRGLRSDAEYARSVLDGVSGPIVLAGHSYGGSVMSEAADGHPNVRALVYVAGFILESGESTGQLGPDHTELAIRALTEHVDPGAAPPTDGELDAIR